ncbi:MAG: hypothetical protein AAFV53_26180 [Myxococcota bacterium]
MSLFVTHNCTASLQSGYTSPCGDYYEIKSSIVSEGDDLYAICEVSNG